ncbi:serine/threonine-protein kinase pim-1-like [Cyprinodon tularosa]|uniref:serine/threonine-protein kinase pim-1-like n=1 Tax=Cyprinodon tularosa TaxID=77115 RepID=UPI0018E24751|nr:serine/threonine-protein kinase pim-1-like [Cyprinodon tularosa]
MTLESPTKRKNSTVDETPRKKFKVSTGDGAYTRCLDQISIVRSKKKNIFDEGDSTARKRFKVSTGEEASTGCLDQISTVRSKKSNIFEQGGPLPAKNDYLTSLSLSPMSDNLLQKQNLKKRSLKSEAEDFLESPNVKRLKTENTNDETEDSLRAKFRETYIEQTQIGDGGSASVFAGYRVHDKLSVAIKHIEKDMEILKHVDENGKQMPSEVAIMLKLRDKTTSSVGQSAIVSLLDWYDLNEELILVLERPMPAEDLFDYIRKHKGHITMKNAKIIIKQLLKAVIHLQEANIFHRDIKAENILIETGSKFPKIHLIDFGSSCFDDLKNYKHFHGTWVHVPPEFDKQGFHSSGPTNVWQVGLVLYYILHKKQFLTRGFLSKLKINTRLSETCKDFLTKCLTVDPNKTPHPRRAVTPPLVVERRYSNITRKQRHTS